jgi:histidyl-tRNA synthetase
MTDRKIYKPKPVSGFPEWLPEIRATEQSWMDHIRRVFESYGYTNIETPSVEVLDVLAAKGEVDKEIYVIERLQKDPDDKSDARLALHFDQTVPFARYVAQHFGSLTFPFKRYQMQKNWRGERPQIGRAREFYQCDIDVIGIDHLPLHFDAEMPAVMFDAIAGLGIGRVQIRISNRKILLGYLESIDVPTPDGKSVKMNSNLINQIIRELDKLDKMDSNIIISRINTVQGQFELGTGLGELIIPPLLEIFKTKYKNSDELRQALEKNESINTNYPTIKEGVDELSYILDNLSHLPDEAVLADLSIIRGFDYYTGTVYEAKLLDMPEFTRSVGGGGRYADLAGQYINKNLPGVGISIGLTCLFDVLHHHGKIPAGRKSPTDVLVLLPSEERRDAATRTAAILRGRGMNVELFHKSAKIGDQMQYANKKDIPYVWIPPFTDEEPHKVKDMRTGEQIDNVDPANWVLT